MNAVKSARVDAIRANTAYPAYRGIIAIITTLMTILAGLQAIGALVLGAVAGEAAHNALAGFVVVLIGLVVAVLAFFLAKIWNEGAQILVDIGDSVLDANLSAVAAPSPLSNHTAPLPPVPSHIPPLPPAPAAIPPPY